MLLVSSIPTVNIYSEEKKLSYCKLINGKILFDVGDSFKVIPIDGEVKRFYNADDGLYYLKIVEDGDDEIFYIGFKEKKSTEILFEKKLPAEILEYRIKRFSAVSGIVYILSEEGNEKGRGNTLYRININNMDVSQIKNVLDICIDGARAILLEKSNEGTCVNINGAEMSLSLKGEIEIKRLFDNRLLFVTNGEDTEVIDTRRVVSLYQYSNRNEYLVPEKYNLIIRTIDRSDEGYIDAKTMIFYKVFVNGIESGRTETGLSEVYSEFKDRIEPNKYYIIKLERWQLNRAKKRYERVNNINQPKPIRLFIPDMRIIKIEVKFNGRDYGFTKSVVYK